MEPSSYVIRGGRAGRERLRILARVVRPTTRSLFERVGPRPGMACLDVGCGGGDATVEMARLVGPQGRVVGIDVDAAEVELARREAAQARLENVEFRVAEVGQAGAEGEFDFVYVRFVLTHLRDPSATLARLRALLRPGGVAVVEDIDFRGHFCHPDSAAFRRYLEIYAEVARRRGADPDIGPRLPGMLREAGYENVQLQVVQPAGMEGEVKRIAAITMENIVDAVVAEGLATRDEIDATIRELYRVAEDGHTVMSLPRIVQTWGYRGLAAPGVPP